MEVTIGEMYGWTTTQTSKSQNDLETSMETHNTQLEHQLHDFSINFSMMI